MSLSLRSPSHRLAAVTVVTLVAAFALASSACGGNPPPKTEDSANQDTPKTDSKPSGGPVVEQELGSIDPRAVEQTFDRLLQGKLETCHHDGRGRLEYLSGEAKLFLRVGKDGKVRYAFFDESTIGDRGTEKCVMDVLIAADWPKPVGGEAEIRSSFSWSGGDERAPAPWGPEKVSTAIEADHGAKVAVEKCRGGLSGAFRVTAYVEPGEVETTPASNAEGTSADAKKGDPKKHDASRKGDHKAGEHKKAEDAKKSGEHGGRFKAIGVAPPGKDGIDKLDCIVDALKGVSLPSPGSYVAKVTFTL